MWKIDITPVSTTRWKQFYEWSLTASWDYFEFDNLDWMNKFAVQIWAMPADTIEIYASLYNSWVAYVQLLNDLWVNPAVQNTIVQEDIATYRRIKIVKTGASDVVPVAVTII